MTAQVITAYTDLEKKQMVAVDTWDAATMGEVEEWSSEGLLVHFPVGPDQIPVTAQYFVEWGPVVYAVWNEEEEENAEGTD